MVFVRGIPPIVVALAALALLSPLAKSQQPVEQNQFLREAFLKHELSAQPFGPARWLNGGEACTTVEASAPGREGRDIVRYETATAKRDVLISAPELVPAGANEPLEIEDYDWSADMNRLLVYTNSRRL
jgi:dipeptidyl-peptidase 4